MSPRNVFFAATAKTTTGYIKQFLIGLKCYPTELPDRICKSSSYWTQMKCAKQ